eukprot:RCo043225
MEQAENGTGSHRDAPELSPELSTQQSPLGRSPLSAVPPGESTTFSACSSSLSTDSRSEIPCNAVALPLSGSLGNAELPIPPRDAHPCSAELAAGREASSPCSPTSPVFTMTTSDCSSVLATTTQASPLQEACSSSSTTVFSASSPVSHATTESSFADTQQLSCTIAGCGGGESAAAFSQSAVPTLTTSTSSSENSLAVSALTTVTTATTTATTSVKVSPRGTTAGRLLASAMVEELATRRSVREKQKLIEEESKRVKEELSAVRKLKAQNGAEVAAMSAAIASESALAKKYSLMERKVKLMEESEALEQREAALVEQQRNPTVVLTPAEVRVLRGMKA